MDGVTATVAGLKVSVKGKLGKLSSTMQGGITAKVEYAKTLAVGQSCET